MLTWILITAGALTLLIVALVIIAIQISGRISADEERRRLP